MQRRTFLQVVVVALAAPFIPSFKEKRRLGEPARQRIDRMLAFSDAQSFSNLVNQRRYEAMLALRQNIEV